MLCHHKFASKQDGDTLAFRIPGGAESKCLGSRQVSIVQSRQAMVFSL